MAGDVEQVSLVHLLAPAQPGSSHAARSRLWAKERSTIWARSLKASLATPDNSRVRLLGVDQGDKSIGQVLRCHTSQTVVGRQLLGKRRV